MIVQAVQEGVQQLLRAGGVVLRVAHSWIQCTYNKVMHRFYVYCAGGTVLWVLWAVLGYGLLRA